MYMPINPAGLTPRPLINHSPKPASIKSHKQNTAIIAIRLSNSICTRLVIANRVSANTSLVESLVTSLYDFKSVNIDATLPENVSAVASLDLEVVSIILLSPHHRNFTIYAI